MEEINESSISTETMKKRRSRRNKNPKIKLEEPKYLTIDIPKEKNDELQSVLISFVTKQQQYSVPKHSISVPENVGPQDLNKIVANMLKAGNYSGPAPEFDFLVNGSMLLSKLCYKLHDGSFINRESVIEVEFIEQLPKPEQQDTLAHDDWVSDLQCVSGFLLTGCYDNSLHIWRPKVLTSKRKEVDLAKNESMHRVKIPNAHKAAVMAVNWLPKSSHKFISGSVDQTVLMWQWQKSFNKIDCLYRCRGHTSSVECLSSKADGEFFTSGSADGEIRLWSTDGSDLVEDEEPQNKKTKKLSKSKVANKESREVMKGHTQKVTGMVWPTLSSLATTSFDHHVKLWDMESSSMTVSKFYVAPCSVLSIDSSPFDNMLLITTVDKLVRLVDPREQNLQLIKSYNHHKKFATRVKWSPSNEKHFVTAGVDKLVKLWDMRSPTAPLYEMLSHEDKVFALDFTKDGTVFSGGADNNVLMFST